jgi:Domain of unknown function (DUF4902)
MKLSLLHPHIPQFDGYVRVPEHTLSELELVHLSSGIDDGLLAELRDGVVDALSAGYTEWQSATGRGGASLSVGWDWYLDGASGTLLIAGGDVRSNIMGVNRLGCDIGMASTAQALSRRLARLNWACTVALATSLSMRAQHAFISPLQ